MTSSRSRLHSGTDHSMHSCGRYTFITKTFCYYMYFLLLPHGGLFRWCHRVSSNSPKVTDYPFPPSDPDPESNFIIGPWATQYSMLHSATVLWYPAIQGEASFRPRSCVGRISHFTYKYHQRCRESIRCFLYGANWYYCTLWVEPERVHPDLRQITMSARKGVTVWLA